MAPSQHIHVRGSMRHRHIIPYPQPAHEPGATHGHASRPRLLGLVTGLSALGLRQLYQGRHQVQSSRGIGAVWMEDTIGTNQITSSKVSSKKR